MQLTARSQNESNSRRLLTYEWDTKWGKTRSGSVIDVRENSADFLGALTREALRVKQTALKFVAASATSAAAWLLELANANALGTDPRLPKWAPPPAGRFRFSPNCLMGFRGQRGEYVTIIPSLHRMPKTEQMLHGRAYYLFRSAISAWHNTYFRYSDGTLGIGGVENEAAQGAAQHYGLGTTLVDWTWDPLVAMAFALEQLSPGESGCVYLRDWDPFDDLHNILLPPLFLSRVWRQRGFFTRHEVAPADWDGLLTRAIDGGHSRFLGIGANYSSCSERMSMTSLGRRT